MKTFKIKTLLAVILTAGLCLAGCDEGTSEPVRVYTEQTAQALIDGCENISMSILVGAIIIGILS